MQRAPGSGPVDRLRRLHLIWTISGLVAFLFTSGGE